MKRHLSIIAALTVAFAAISGTAKADNDFSLHLEPSVVVPVTAPQSSIYEPGLGLGVKGLFALDRHWLVGPSLSTMYLTRKETNDGQGGGVVWQMGGSARLQTDRRNTNTNKLFSKVSPWVDVDLAGAVTGSLVLPAIDVGVGAEVPLDQNHIAWMGPFVRWTTVLQTASQQDALPLDKRYVNFLQVGVSVSFDTPTTPKKEVKVVKVGTPVFIMLPPPDAEPCPPTKSPSQATEVDLSEIVYFDHDSSKLRWESNDKLDAVVKVLNAHPKSQIKVQGHASSDGKLAYNQKLATKRTEAVVAYLTAHGVDGSRLKAESFGVSRPIAPNTSKEGRERNRRVEFTVSFTSVETK